MHIFKRLGCNTVLPILAILLGYFAFLILAGYILVVVEEEEDEKIKQHRRLEFLRVLDKYNITHNNTMIHEIVTAASNAFTVNGLDLTDYSRAVKSEWSIGSSVFFAGTIVTTIGYGNIVPATAWGKGFCIILAIIGIPFTGIVLGKIGVAFTNLIKKADNFIENRIKQCFPKASKEEKMKAHVRKIQLVCIFSLFIILFLLIPAAVFTEFEEDWRYFDSFYYCFISLTTIGLGDMTPGGSLKDINLKGKVSLALVENSLRQGTVMLYLLFGLAALSIILAMIGSILQSAAEKTLQSGTSLMSKGGQALKGAGGLELVSETRRLATSIRKKTASTLGFIQSEPATEYTKADEESEGKTISNSFAEERNENLGDKNSELVIVSDGKRHPLQDNATTRNSVYVHENDEKESLVVATKNDNTSAELPTASSCGL